MSRLRIGLDIDGVLYHFHKTAIYLLNTLKNYHLEVKEWSDWDWLKEQTFTSDWNWLWKEGVKDYGLFRYGHIYKGAIEGVRKLAKLGDIVVISHRPKNAIGDTLDWLSYNKFPVQEIHLLTNQEPKSQVQPRCDIYIDDGLHNATDLSRFGTVLLVDRPWNQDCDYTQPNVVIRVKDWNEIVEGVEKYG